jgi:uncharacterized protein YeaO (DUF488 family)
LWLKEIAPSTELRKWFHAATPDHWQEFKERYLKELETNSAVEYKSVTVCFAMMCCSSSTAELVSSSFK